MADIFEPIWAVGLMTGTVLDGNIDVALLKTDGETIETFGAYTLAPYPPEIRTLLEETLKQARAWNFEGPEPDIFREAEGALTRAQSQAVKDLVESAGLTMADIGIVGFHGQTVLHRAPTKERLGDTRQLGDGELMAPILGTKVAYDFRSTDVRAGGQGAPLAAAYHSALLRSLDKTGETAVLNLGGVANITWWDGGDLVVAFDTGPANAPLNDFMKARGLGEMDFGGALGASGTVDEARLAELTKHPYLTAAYPKSLDRFSFTAAMADGLGDAEGAATLSAFTASAVGKALDLLPRRPKRLIVSGGGRHNPTIMAMLEDRAGAKAVSADQFGWRGDAVEAECFAFLAVRVLRGLPISFPTTTGAPKPLQGGRLAG
ncbi:anhydro-N-acetylmuramic acid kinase [Neorhizobium alkalisoli]|uniref:Anhydro-N-acetylmuramic acid kinase n=1 Tax=Neorhizobium alkalisoli TaxID=528178 RepID=A0A561R6L8_9HYPH|nr:anhydro-N-acetylmuramic acid kinase [Neorhizobium alkalisoli]TWF58244.1 anhydro-N-acetylmuramic acid kinase [Neorhizobium alkalisoli]